MSKLSNVKLVVGDGEKSKNGKGTAVKKIHRKIVKKQTDAIVQLSATVRKAPEVLAKSKVLQKVLRAPKETVKKSITPSVAKKSPAQKVLAVTTERTPINRQKSIKPIKKRPLARAPNSVTIDGAETKKLKPVKRVLKAIPTTTTIAKPSPATVSAAPSPRLEGTKPTKSAVKRSAKGVVKRVLRKKLEPSTNRKIVEPKTVDKLAVENQIPILLPPRILHNP